MFLFSLEKIPRDGIAGSYGSSTFNFRGISILFSIVEKRTTEARMVGWCHWLNGHEFEQAPESVTDREAWRAAVHGVAKSRTRLAAELNWTTSIYIPTTLCKGSLFSTSSWVHFQIFVFQIHPSLPLPVESYDFMWRSLFNHWKVSSCVASSRLLYYIRALGC